MKNIHKILLIIILLLSFSALSVSSDSDWIIDGDKVYIDDDNVYLSASPHTIIDSTWVEFELISKRYTGDIDVVWGFNHSVVRPKQPQRWNGTAYVPMQNNFIIKNHEWGGCNKWYILKDVPIVEDVLYKVRAWMQLQFNTSGKYWFAVKPSGETLQEAIASGHLYYLDPWWDSDWPYFKVLPIHHPCNGYQMKIVVGNSTGGDVDCDGNIGLADFTDLRFIDKDQTTMLDYWIENCILDTQVIIWVKTPSDVEIDQEILMFYGNPEATNVSNSDTFLDFIDDLTGWTGDTGRLSMQAGRLRFTDFHTASSYSVYHPLDNDGINNIVFEMKYKSKEVGPTDIWFRHEIENSDSDRFTQVEEVETTNDYSYMTDGIQYILRTPYDGIDEERIARLNIKSIAQEFDYFLMEHDYLLLDSVTNLDYSLGNPNNIDTAYLAMHTSTPRFCDISIDWIRVRKYTATTPYWGTPGGQQGQWSPPTNFTATTVSNSEIYLNWTKGTHTTHTHIVRKIGGYPADINDGTNIYNDTGIEYSDSSLSPMIAYFYSAWGYNDTQGYTSNVLIWNHTGPTKPTNVNTFTGMDYINFTWTKGDRADKISIIHNSTEIYNDTGTWYNDTTYYSGYYALFSWNETVKLFSIGVSIFYVCPPTNFTATTVSNSEIYLNWTKGTDATHTHIVRKIGGYPIDINDGINIYNGTGIEYSDSGLSPMTMYFYKAWSYNTGNYSVNCHISNHTGPTNPIDVDSSMGINYLNISWTKGERVDTTIIMHKASSYPSNPSDGTEIYNDTGIWYNDTTYYSGYYMLFSWNNTVHLFSTGHYLEPLPPTNFIASSFNNTIINLSWTKGVCGTYTQIQRKTTGFPSNINDGTTVYNDIGTSYSDTNLVPFVLYYFSAWSHNVECGYSTEYITISNHTGPTNPINIDASTAPGWLNITWTNGQRSDSTLVIRNNNSIPQSIMDGYEAYNGSLEYYNDSDVAGQCYFKLYSYNFTNNFYSSGIYVEWGALFLGCFDESDMSQGITFNIEITDTGATQTYVQSDLTNYHYVDINDIPYGDDTIFIFSASGYRQRTYYYDLAINNVYNITAYLPPIEEEGGDEGDGEDCQFLLYSDSKTITNPAVDTTITLTHDLEEIVNVDIYDSTFYGTYGGWVIVPSDKFTYSSTQVIVDNSVLDSDTTMARATYYYEHCGAIRSLLCQITVINEYDQRVPNTKCTVQRLKTEEYVNISTDYTDGNGQFTIWLIPLVNYRFVIEKDGYIQEGNKFWTPSAKEYMKIFRLTYEPPEPTEEIDPHTIITFNAYFLPDDNNTMHVNFTDSSGNTTDGLVIIYRNGTLPVYNMTITTSDHNFTWTNANHSRYDYEVILYIYNHSNIGNWSTQCILPKYVSPKKQFAIDLDIDLSSVLGENPLGWVTCLVFFFGTVVLTNFGKRWAGIAIMSLGGLLFLLEVLIGLPGFTVAQMAAIPFFLVYGFLVEIAKKKKEVRL